MSIDHIRDVIDFEKKSVADREPESEDLDFDLFSREMAEWDKDIEESGLIVVDEFPAIEDPTDSGEIERNMGDVSSQVVGTISLEKGIEEEAVTTMPLNELFTLVIEFDRKDLLD
ncbi:hypothetical protein ACFL21_02740, partial [Patescibacteria group bacterium]